MDKRVTISLFTVITTFLAIYLNFSKFLMGDNPTIFNLIVSLIFLTLWFIFSLYWGIRQEEKYQKFILIYWFINFFSFALMWLFVNSAHVSFFLIPFAIWYGGPVYGLRYLIKVQPITLAIVTAPFGLIINFLGYWIGLAVSNTIRKIED